MREAIDDKECEEICNNQDDRLPYYGLNWCGSSKLSYLGQGVVKYSEERLAALDYANGGWRIDFEGSV